MAELSNANSAFLSTKRYAVVTGANRGIGLEICRQLASTGVTVLLTARDAAKGIQALEDLNKQDISLAHFLEFHQLDVADPTSVASLSDFIESKFGKLDILPREQINFDEFATNSYSMAKECFQTNYFGSKILIEALLPHLQLSDAGRIVNVSSSEGLLKNIPNESTRGILGNVDTLTEEKIDGVVNEFLEDLKKGELVAKGWPNFFPSYSISKAAINAYTRIVARLYPDVDINCVCPGFTKTDFSHNGGVLSVEEGAESPVWIALMSKGNASGSFFKRKEVSPF